VYRTSIPSKEVGLDNISLSAGHYGVTSYDPILSPLNAPPPSILGISSFSQKTPNLHSEINLLVCRCSLIHEDSAEGGDNEIEGDTETTTISQSHSDSELAAEEEGSEIGELGHASLRNFGNLLELPVSRSSTKQHVTGVSASRPLVSVRSSPQLLNEICEEAEHDDENDHSRSVVSQTARSSRRNSTDMPRRRDRMQRVHHRTIGVIAPRVASCSSSDASDTDDVEQRSTKQKQKMATGPTSGTCLRNLGRRDSSEHSSDNDNQPSNWSSFGAGDGNCGPLCGSSKDQSNNGKGNCGGGKQMGQISEQHQQPCDSDIASDGGHPQCVDSSLMKDSQLASQRFEDDRYIPNADYFVTASLATGNISNKNNRLSNVIRFHSMEFGNFVESSAKTKLKNVVKMRCHSTIDIGCDGTHAVAAALLAKLSCIDILERRSHSVSCLRARKVSM